MLCRVNAAKFCLADDFAMRSVVVNFSTMRTYRLAFFSRVYFIVASFLDLSNCLNLYVENQ